MSSLAQQVLYFIQCATSLSSRNLSMKRVGSLLLKLLTCFFVTTGQLIFITAIDRYIHMKYRNKYSTIMTPSRARFVMVFIVILGIVVSAPNYAGIEAINLSPSLGISVFLATSGISVSFICTKAHYSIRRGLRDLQIRRISDNTL